MAANNSGVAGERRHFLDHLLSPFTKLEPGEGTNAILLTLSVFLLLTSYYVLKVVREPLILAAGGATLKSYTSAAQACCCSTSCRRTALAAA
jgi:AAA family ATP:ADP antiporter